MTAKILVIDDEKNIGELIQLALRPRGYQVQYSTTGAGGIEAFRQFRTDLALVDLSMPDMDGLEVARRLKESDSGRNMPIILMTGRVVEGQEMSSGLFAEKLEKPFNMATLGSTVDKYLGKC